MPRSLVTKSGEDRFYTPPQLAKDIIDHFKPDHSYLEPCLGAGAFYNNVNLVNKDYCEIDLGIDFLKYTKKVNWIITNPPFSIFRPFLTSCLNIANNVVFLCPINHFTTKARVKLIFESGFYIKEILLLNDTPKEFPTSGFQWGVIHLTKGVGETKIHYLRGNK